jgi:hypothetical protein
MQALSAVAANQRRKRLISNLSDETFSHEIGVIGMKLKSTM